MLELSLIMGSLDVGSRSCFSWPLRLSFENGCSRSWTVFDRVEMMSDGLGGLARWLNISANASSVTVFGKCVSPRDGPMEQEEGRKSKGFQEIRC